MLEQEIQKVYEVAKRARGKGLDPTLTPESSMVIDLPSLVEALVGPKGVGKIIRELSKFLPREEVALKVAEGIVRGNLMEGEKPEKIAEQAIRTGLAILTEGVTAAPVQGISGVKIKEGPKGKYLAVYFAGPIRSAGGTDQALTVVLSDYVRQLLGLPKYSPSRQAVERFIEEIRLYERNVTRFQYHFSDETLRFVLERLPVEVTGVKTDPIEVSTYRNVPGIETNGLRGGALLVVNDGLLGRAPKVLAIVERVGLAGWDWLKEVSIKKEKSKGIMEEVIAGRPVFSISDRPGGFRLRYGRARNTGLACVGIHPLTMKILHNFLAIGTQIKLDLPAKGGIVTPVDYIEPPIIKTPDGTVLRVTSEDEIPEEYHVLFLGDLLISYGDFHYANKELAPSGYVEEWWSQDLHAKINELGIEQASSLTGISTDRLELFVAKPFEMVPSFAEAKKISELGVPLHPQYTFFWRNLQSGKEVLDLRRWLFESEVDIDEKTIVGDLWAKPLLEAIYVPHKVEDGKILISGKDALALMFNLGYGREVTISEDLPPLEIVKKLAGVEIKDRVGTWLNARMGRPEKAKRREMKPVVHVLFPVGLAGKSQRNVLEAAKKGIIEVDLEVRKCPKCGLETFKFSCPKCNNLTYSTGRHAKQKVNLKEEVSNAYAKARVGPLKVVKGVKGLMNKTRTAEPLIKGFLRAKYNLSVYRDGTVRFDATNAPLTHFKPKEIGVPVEKLRELGYLTDYKGRPLTSPEQICELKFQDVIIPKKCAEYLVRVAQFLDDLLTKVYGEPAFYKVTKPEDLIGHLIIGLAPHTLCGVFGRIIGITKSAVCYAHPIWHSAKRRDCDGDEDAIMLALDVLINFSKSYLPEKVGGIMDAPILLISSINLKEIQRQALEVDVDSRYPKEFYEATWKNVPAKEFTDKIRLIQHLVFEKGTIEFTTPTSNIDSGNLSTVYSRLPTMPEKISAQFELMERLSSVDVRDVALKVLTTHFLRDIIGNLRAFTIQAFRCKSCNRKYRRPPLSGRCLSCGGELTLTVHRGGIEKYLNLAEHLVERYQLPEYYMQRIQLVRDEINLLFERAPKEEKSPVKTLTEFM
ncbi:MAG TPA: DNA polymerase II large subunit [Thermococcus sp.]|nr:DNA polymerase II large subunit [Thermococcus sp.]